MALPSKEEMAEALEELQVAGPALDEVEEGFGTLKEWEGFFNLKERATRDRLRAGVEKE